MKVDIVKMSAQYMTTLSRPDILSDLYKIFFKRKVLITTTFQMNAIDFIAKEVLCYSLISISFKLYVNINIFIAHIRRFFVILR